MTPQGSGPGAKRMADTAEARGERRGLAGRPRRSGQSPGPSPPSRRGLPRQARGHRRQEREEEAALGTQG